MRYEFHPEALEEYDKAAHYYAKQQPGLDLRFVASVENAIEVILEDPLRWRSFDEDVRRCLTRVFPYAILTASSRIWCSSLLWPIAAGSRTTGSIESPNGCNPPKPTPRIPRSTVSELKAAWQTQGQQIQKVSARWEASRVAPQLVSAGE